MHRVKRKLLRPAAFLFLLVFLAGCGNSPPAKVSAPADSSGQAENSSTGGAHAGSAPDAAVAKLFGTLRRVEELAGDKDHPLSADQVKKILPIVKDISAQKEVTAAYATEKQKEITAVLSPEQQKAINALPQRKVNSGERSAGNRSGNPANATGNGSSQGGFQSGFLEHLISVLQQKAGS